MGEAARRTKGGRRGKTTQQVQIDEEATDDNEAEEESDLDDNDDCTLDTEGEYNVLYLLLDISKNHLTFNQAVIGLSTQVAWRLLVHRGGAQVPRLGSQKKTTIAGLGMVEQEARGLAGTGSRHGRSATSMETMDMEDRAVCMEVQAPPQGGPSSRSIQMVTT
ncbi:uncharacterized protein UHOD_11750 [Ustilago sp. UG-2017b]|nr:uncharacterized protein UHOD_11750 [Ustilago sp. UG-2017b]